ncbi:MAG: CotH kinase family protein [Fibrobacter sp.]|nr:CotH kinase family protein [Fibrobacter sp.]
MKTKKKMHFAHWGFAMLLAGSLATSTFAQGNSGTGGFTIKKPLEAAYVAVTDEGGTATLSFVVEGYDNISYQWYKSTDGTNENGTAIEGATGSSYTTEELAAKTSFYYYCVATAGEKSVKSNVTMVANTGFPTLYVNTPGGAEIESKEIWTNGTKLTLKDAGNDNFENVSTGFRGRGNSTWLQDKKPYAIKLDSKQKILGMPKHKRWVLIANYLDNSFLKNHIAFYLSEKLGMDYTVQGEFVNLVFNGVYRGLYWLGEAIKVDESRVDIYDGNKKMKNEEDKDFLIEMDTHYDEVVRFHSSIRNMPYMIKNDDYMIDEVKDENGVVISSSISEGGQARLNRFQDKIASLENLLYPDYGTNDDCKANTNDCSAPDEAYKDIIDVESWAKFWLINEIMDNTELMGSAESDGPKSAYFTYQNKKEGDVFKAGPVWDFDAGAKTKDAPIKLDTTIYYNALFKSPSFVAAVKNVWNTFVSENIKEGLESGIESAKERLGTAAKLDSMRWGAHRDYVQTTDLSFSGSVDFLEESLLNKMDVVNNFITKMVDLSTLTADYEAKDGDILTGKLAGNYKISIEDGAKVTLKNATIQGPQNVTGEWAGITCNGDCNIMLDGVNTVKGFSGHYSGIHVPVGKTLTIDGSGKLSASSGSDVDEYRTALAAGIGGGSYRADVSDMSCGNIVIKGGIITAAGGSSGGAGIGSGYYGISMERADEAATITIGKITISGGTVTATGGRYGGAGIGTGENYYGTFYLGDITISGGIVAATGGQSAAGIGVGEFPFGTAHLGDITITNGVKKVTVTKGNDECPGWLCAKHSVGIGYTSDFGGCVSFGKITIGDKETEFIEESPFVYPTPIADFAAVQIYKYNNGITRAELDGNYGGEGEVTAISIPSDVKVDEVEFSRSFPTGKFSTVVLPFNVNTSEVSGLDAVLRYNGIGSKDGKKAIKMKVVWATDKWVEDNQIKDDKGKLMHYDATGLMANTPYMMQMSNPTFKVNNTASIVLKQTAKAETEKDGWIFRGTWEYKKWAEGDPELGYAYGFAANASDDDKIQVGDFVKVGVGAWIRPMRAYLVRKDKAPVQGVRANGNYVMRPSIVQEELPELMSVIIGGDDGNEEQTTVIGHFNTRTGEFKMNRSAGARTFDLKGRYVGDKANKARGAYYGKNVKK